MFQNFENKTDGGVLDFIEWQKGLKGEDAVNWMRNDLGLPISTNGASMANHNGHDHNGHDILNGTETYERKEAPEYKRGPLVGTFSYTDESGVEQFQVLRFLVENLDGSPAMKTGKQKKEHRQRRRPMSGDDPSRIKNGWVWTTKESRQVLFRLPELIAAVRSGALVVIAEGEPKVNLLTDKWGVSATCNPMGAGCWRSEYNRYFRGADVVILPDNDDVGLESARNIANNLSCGFAKRVRILELPGLPPR